MALYVSGIKCRLCDKPIVSDHDRIMFPRFTVNENSPLHKFDDAVAHKSCFNLDRHYMDMCLVMSTIESCCNCGINNLCVVCGGAIANPDDFFSLGYVVAAECDLLLYEYNFAMFHKQCVPNWKMGKQYIQKYKYHIETGDIGGKYAIILYNRIRLLLQTPE